MPPHSLARRALPGVALLALSAALLSQTPAAPRKRPLPNLVLVFVDDMGWGDIGVQGARGFATPHLDAMAREGVRLTDFYAAQPVCSASRAAILTGCYPNRIGIHGAYGPGSRVGISADETTLAEICKQKGYATAIFGKWHLGHRPPFLPSRHGFDRWVGTPYSNDMWPLHPDVVRMPEGPAKRKRAYPPLPLHAGDGIEDPEVTAEDQKRFTKRFTEEAVAFIEAHRNRPFFLYLAHPMPHVPLFCDPSFEESSRQGRYGDVIQEIDWSVGKLRETLSRLGLSEDTLFLFTSDNGPWLSYGNHAGSTGGLREGKGTVFEGGVRVPFLATWPGRIPAGRVCREPAMTIDVLPTFARLIGAALPEHPIDGRDIGPLLFGERGARSPHEALWFYYHRNQLQALRAGRYKIVFPHRHRSLTKPAGRDGRPAGYTYPTCGLMLFDLATDPGETRDLAAERPKVVARLQALAEEARRELGDALTKREGRGRRPVGRAD
jgi:arylsulfatase A